jgi:hypothetical protein
MEMSRQRIRTGVLESSTEVCPACGGTGHVRAVSSVALQLLRAIEDQLMKSASHDLVVRTRPDIALYVLNNKRAHLRGLEEHFGAAILIQSDQGLAGQQYFAIRIGSRRIRSHPNSRRSLRKRKRAPASARSWGKRAVLPVPKAKAAESAGAAAGGEDAAAGVSRARACRRRTSAAKARPRRSPKPRALFLRRPRSRRRADLSIASVMTASRAAKTADRAAAGAGDAAGGATAATA